MASKKEDVEEIKDAVEGENSKKKESKKEKEPELTDLPGIGPAVAAKLESAGIFDLMSLAVMSPAALSDAAGVSSAVARKAIQASRNMLSLGFSDGMEFAKKRSSVFYITTGSKNFDTLLGGKGLESRAITEAFGAFGSGKCVSKDTPVCYLNDTRMHVEQIQQTYEKYNQRNSEFSVDEGFAVPVNTVKVLGWVNGRFKIVNATNLYREKVKQLFLIKTKRGRVLKVTGKHQLLSFEKGVNWKRTSNLKKGDLVACPREIDLETENIYDEDDAYFLGLFVAEGSSNPFSISTGSRKLKDWVCDYVERKFGYFPTVREDKRRKNVCYNILLRKNSRVIMEGLDKCNAETKFIPEGIFLSNNKVVSHFLGGYLDGDGEVSQKDISVTTKSDKLAIQLSYLLLKLGIASTVKKRLVDKGIFRVVRISGEDREKAKSLNFKLKSFDNKTRNSAYGYPKQIMDFISDIYKECLGGNRGRIRKNIGKRNTLRTIYSNFIGNYNAKAINSKTLNKIEEVFENQKDLFLEILQMLQKQELNKDILRSIYPDFPFAFNSLSEKMGIKKKSIQNYYSRKLPKTKSGLLKNLIINELRTRVDLLYLALEVISEIKMFSWDVVESVERVNYDDYVYDFVVPEGHSFVGGNMPTMMHNTQLSLALAVNCQLPVEQGGAGGKCVFIDTEGTFRPERIKQIAEGIGADPDKVLKNILVARAFNSDHQILLLEKISEMVKAGEPIKLMVVDSLTAHFRAEYSGRGQLADRQQKLNRYMHELMKLSETHNLAVYVTNQVMANPAQLFGDPTTAIGGNIVGHACLTGDSLIQLADGSIKEIKDLNKDLIISGNFKNLNFEEANSETKFVNPDINKIYNIQTTNQINCSGLHRFFSVENFSIFEKEAKDLKEEDFVAQVGKIDFEGSEQELPSVNLKRIGKISRKEGKVISKELKKENIIRKEICKKVGITPRQFRRVLNQSYPTNMEVFDKLKNSLSNQLQLQVIPFYTYKHQNLIMPETMNPQLAQICGYFIGDGNFEDRGLRFRDERLEVLRNYQRFFKNLFNIEGKISKMSNKNCFTLNINSKEITDFFRLIIPDVLNYIAKSKKEVVAGFIKGFVDAEGHIDKKRPRITIAQKEKQILRYLQLFLLRFGIRSFLRLDVGKKRISNLSIRDRSVKDYFQIGFSALEKQKQLIKWAGHIDKTSDKEMMPIQRKDIWNLLKNAGLKPSQIIKPRNAVYKWINRRELKKAHYALMNIKIKDRQIKQKIEFIFNILNRNFRFEKIGKINVLKNEKKELLFDFSVPKNENYIANGFVVHNSTYRLYLRRAKQGSRVAKLIDSPNLPDGEAVYFVTTHGIRDKA